MKTIAFYLPQFHEIPENNKWWGTGFTEWKTVKEAKALYPKHVQPKVPYQNHYYDLLNYNVMKKQTLQAAEGGIDAFCFYHYWFTGKKILEKPVENYLKWKDLKTNYCFSWANESWTRTWNIPNGNSWYQTDVKGAYSKEEDKYLIKQDYGTEKNWEEHFTYLLPFFKDDRYIKKDGKPIFLIYKPDTIPCLVPMIAYFQKMAQKHGFEGVYFILTNASKDYGKFADGYIMYEPGYTLHKDLPLLYKWKNNLTKQIFSKREELRKFSFHIFWLQILQRKIKSEKPVYRGSFCGYDDTARRGNRGIVYHNNTPFMFFVYMTCLLLKQKKNKEEFLFITAWNEWSEGAYLEPDMKYKYGFLKAIKKARWLARY